MNYAVDGRGLAPGELIDKILESRGVRDSFFFLYPDESDLEGYDDVYPQMKEAVDIVKNGIDSKASFFINVDSDTDGITSGAIMYRYLHDCGCTQVDYYVSQGKTHGTSEGLMSKLKIVQPDILIIVDSLDSTSKRYKEINNMGIKVVILDHHDVNPDIDYRSFATLVSSNDGHGNHELSGAGVVWKFCKRLDAEFGMDYADNYIDLAATGIIADMMDMKEMENRYIAFEGLSNPTNPAIKRIIGSYKFNSTAVGFSIAPLINASCRIGKNDLAFRCFIEDDDEVLKKLIKDLKSLKELQNSEISRFIDKCDSDLEAEKDRYVLFAVIDSKYGVAGLVANKMLNKFKRPVIILKEEENKYTGSCRCSYNGNFREVCNSFDGVSAYGHPDAFGIVIEKDSFDDFKKDINKFFKSKDTSEFEKKDVVDALISVDQMTDELIDMVKDVDFITGKGFPQLTFVTEPEEVMETTMSKGKHQVWEYNDYIKFIRWNTGELADEGQVNTMSFVGTLDSGFLGRKYSKRMIVSKAIYE